MENNIDQNLADMLSRTGEERSRTVKEIAEACAEAAFDAQHACVVYYHAKDRRRWYNLSDSEKDDRITDATNILCGDNPFSEDPEDWFGEIFLEVVRATGRVLMRGHIRRMAGKMSEDLSREEILATRDHVSVSRIQKFLQCKLSYKFSYLDKRRPPKSDILNFGTWVHSCLEAIYRWVLLEEHSGRIPKEVISKACADESAKIGGVDLETYNEGFELVGDYCKLNQDIDHSRVIAVEKAFQFKLASGVMLVGVIDRLEREDDGTVLVVDYKTNRTLYVEDELEANLQMSTYGLAVKTLWPNVKTVKYRFDMLRFCKELTAERTVEELEQALDYLSAMSIAIRDAKEFPAKINQFCPWCDHRDYCDDYQALIKSDPEKIEYSDDIAGICNAREQVSAIERDAKRKRQELEHQIRAHMRKNDLDKLDVDGLRYLNQQNEEQIYVLEKAFNRINDALKTEAGQDSKEVFNSLVLDARLDHKRLMEFVESLNLDRAKKARLKFDLERDATKKKKSSPFLMAVKIK